MNSFSIFHYLRNNTKVYLLSILFVMVIIGTTMIYSSSWYYAENYWGSPYYFFKRHIFHLLTGIIALRIAMKIPYDRYQKMIPLLMFVTFLLLLLVLIPGIGTKAGNARRWIRMLGVGFQPSEVLKFTLIVWTAGFLNRKKAVLGYFSRGLFPTFVVLGGYFFLLLLQPDFGSAVLISLTVFMMIFVAGVRPMHMFISLLGMAGASALLIVGKTYRMRRVIGFLDPWADPLDTGFQLIQSFIAYGTGGIFGQGLGNSKQNFLPEGHTDFIFSILAEETGIIGVSVVLLLLMLLMRKGFEISLKTSDDFGRNLAFGITTLIILQSMLHIGVVTGLLPTKGIPLPFISYGGSSLILNMFLIGVLINVAESKPRREEKEKK